LRPSGDGVREIGHFAGAQRGGALVLAPNGVVDFFAVDRDFRWRRNPKADLVASDVNDGDFDLVADHDGFVALS